MTIAALADGFARFDANHDGRISHEETDVQALATFKELGFADSDVGRRAFVGATRMVHDHFDANRDGGLTTDEIDTGVRDLFRALAGQNEGGGSAAAVQWFHASDANGDGALSGRELTNGIAPELKRAGMGDDGMSGQSLRAFVSAAGAGAAFRMLNQHFFQGGLTLEAFKEIVAEAQP